MSEKSLNLTRRRFMAVSSAAIASPILKNMVGMVPEAKAAEKQYDFVDKKSCDLVVLGGGASGMVSAVRAAQLSGKKVIVLEKAAYVGGAGIFAGGFGTFGSQWQAVSQVVGGYSGWLWVVAAAGPGIYWLLRRLRQSGRLQTANRSGFWGRTHPASRRRARDLRRRRCFDRPHTNGRLALGHGSGSENQADWDNGPGETHLWEIPGVCSCYIYAPPSFDPRFSAAGIKAGTSTKAPASTSRESKTTIL